MKEVTNSIIGNREKQEVEVEVLSAYLLIPKNVLKEE
jgi:hypothetical protein